MMENKRIWLLLFLFSLFLQAQESEIAISKQRIEKEFSARSSALGRDLSDVEKEKVVRNLVYDEVLLREAIRLKLHFTDKEVRRRLVTLMDYVYSPRINDPEEDQLKQYFEENKSRFAVQTKYSFDHIYFKEQPDLDVDQLKDFPDWEKLGSEHWIQKRLKDKTDAEVKMFLGPDIAQSLPDLEMNQWYGPYQSAIGYHFIRLTDRIEGRLRNYEEVDKQFILTSWRTEQKQIKYEEELEVLSRDYEIHLPSEYQ